MYLVTVYVFKVPHGPVTEVIIEFDWSILPEFLTARADIQKRLQQANISFDEFRIATVERT